MAGEPTLRLECLRLAVRLAELTAQQDFTAEDLVETAATFADFIENKAAEHDRDKG